MAFDFWRLPAAEEFAMSESGDDAAVPALLPPSGPLQAMEEDATAALPHWTLGEPRHPGPPGTPLGDLEACLGLDEAAVREFSCPVPLASAASYLARLRLDGKSAEQGGLQKKVQYWAAGQLAKLGGADAVPADLWGPAGGSGRCGLRAEGFRWDPAVGAWTDATIPRAATVATPAGIAHWREFFGDSLSPIDPAICGPIGPVPPLPNRLTILSDVPQLAEQMLARLPREEWESQKARSPEPLEGLPGLCRGPGDLVPSQTPRQVAQNLIAAAILNRLCGNLLTTLSRAVATANAAAHVTPQVRAVVAAKNALKARTGDLEQATVEERAARNDFCAFQAKFELDAERQHHLESVVGWKSSLRLQAEAELEEAGRELRVAEEALAASRTQAQLEPWHRHWPSCVPAEAAAEPLFGVQLTATAPLLTTLPDFFEAMGNGFVDRTGSGIVTKHKLEGSFIRFFVDRLLLCQRAGEEAKASQVCTHIPTPLTTGTRFVMPGMANEIRVPEPHHAFHLRLDGQNFAFSVAFGAVGDRGLGFNAIGANAVTYSTPWNQFEYDVLWAHHTKEALGLIPLVAVTSSLVGDPNLTFGLFPPVPHMPGTVPLGTVGVALLHAAIFLDVKMWPVVLPDAARVRWEYGLRALRHALAQCQDEDRYEVNLGWVRDAASQCLKALPKVPNDESSGSSAGCRGFGDRLKRMALSIPTRAPQRSAVALREALLELEESWPRFEEEGEVT